MHDEAIRILSDVRHVPDLKKNLISLRILNSKGCGINIELSGIKVSYGAPVLMKGKKIGSLYVLEGSMLTNEIGRPLSIKESKLTSLKWRQLDYGREKGMTVLYKRNSFLDASFENIGYCVCGNQIWVSFDLAVHKLKTRRLLASKHSFDSINILHSLRQVRCGLWQRRCCGNTSQCRDCGVTPCIFLAFFSQLNSFFSFSLKL
ncbi:hypothetical protein J1N35_005470 [Gossypium stocksii]|uniref:Retrovirus-related Pol polyprotein from transposon TNT 1-94-like beta-barrel domain-containing protein n=1 Tax=Gossypium stocksii TaxID=47602 RepID=A0A9D3WFV3_9ROSI|nr:hypothetical protein J1N35_005470 [Gossypium stocksii]